MLKVTFGETDQNQVQEGSWGGARGGVLEWCPEFSESGGVSWGGVRGGVRA